VIETESIEKLLQFTHMNSVAREVLGK